GRFQRDQLEERHFPGRQVVDGGVAAKVADLERHVGVVLLPAGEVFNSLAPIVVAVADDPVAVLGAAPDFVDVAEAVWPDVDRGDRRPDEAGGKGGAEQQLAWANRKRAPGVDRGGGQARDADADER